MYMALGETLPCRMCAHENVPECLMTPSHSVFSVTLDHETAVKSVVATRVFTGRLRLHLTVTHID